ncbi:MAG: tRNA pseudouridine(38-40) synthase TruA [Oscillospiraceae bacterium]|nr:tRNA pseudouridine(38-40) synthase TruA [Oscillospiraceae bacterium]
MRNIKVTMSYCGTAYHGFQRQENAVAVQNVLEDKLSELTNAPVKVNGCSRTDTGVHASEYCFSFFTEHPIPCQSLIRGLNSKLPDDIAVHFCEDVPESFHARFSCTGKEYRYVILNRSTRDPFLSERAFHYPFTLDDRLIEKSAQDFVGSHDFSAFCGISGLKADNVRTIEYFKVQRNADTVELYVKGDGFLYNMVRIMAGTLIYINEGRIAPDAIPSILASKDRNNAGKTAVACGLYLNRVFY